MRRQAVTSDWTPEQLKQCKELTKLVRKAAALKATGIDNQRTRRLEQQC
jgi:hypothetical protein